MRNFQNLSKIYIKKKKIAVFGVKGFPAFGGAARSSESIVNILKDKYDFTIYAISTHTNQKGLINGYNQIVFKGYKNKRINTFVYYTKSTLHALFVGDYDLIQINHIYCGFIVPILRIKYKVISTAHGIIPQDDQKWNRIDKFFFNVFAYMFFKFSNILISVSLPHIKLFEKYTKKKIEYIPNGVKIESNLINAKTNKEDYILFSASRIIPLKGAHLLLEALNKLKYKGKVKLIGDLSQIPEYGTQLKILSSNLNIEFIDVIKDQDILFNYILRSKLFVFPSLNEGMSNMLLEVASLKIPIICSDIVENIAVFNDSEVTFFESNNSENLASKLELALINPKLIEEKATLAYKRVSKHHDWNLIATKYDSIYDFNF